MSMLWFVAILLACLLFLGAVRVAQLAQQRVISGLLALLDSAVSLHLTMRGFTQRGGEWVKPAHTGALSVQLHVDSTGQVFVYINGRVQQLRGNAYSQGNAYRREDHSAMQQQMLQLIDAASQQQIKPIADWEHLTGIAQQATQRTGSKLKGFFARFA